MGAVDSIARSVAVVSLLAIIFATFRLFHGADTPFLAFSVIGAAVVQATKKPRAIEIAVTLTLGTILAGAYARSHGHFGEYFGAGIIAGAAFLGLASMLVLGWKACRATQDLAALLTATFCPLLMIFTNVGLAMAIQLSPKIFDLFLYRFDSLLGLQSSFVVGQFFVRLPFLYTLCFLVYASLPLAEVLAFLLFLRGYRMPANPLVVCAVAGVTGFLLYLVCPATGPIHVFGAAFPQAPPIISSFQAISLADTPRNAIPSLHSAWALLIWWNLRQCPRWIRYTAAAFLAFTLLATLGLGEHYLIDLVVAVPFAVGVQTACRKQWLRSAIALLVTIGWVLYLRFGLPLQEPPRLEAWAAVITTLTASAVLAGRGREAANR
jgi:hypothetical protein